MLRVAILETEAATKEILFTLGNLMQEEDWTYRYFSRLSDFAKAQLEKDFQVVVFQDAFDTPRITGTFIQPYPERMILYTTTDKKRCHQTITAFERVLYIDRSRLSLELKRILPYIHKLLLHQEEYFFSYNNVSVPLKIRDIYYIEKDNKNLIYHTRRGEFSERKNMKDADTYFSTYDFLRIHSSFMVNMQYITHFETDMVYVQNTALPFARARRQKVLEQVKNYAKAMEI